MPNEKNLNKLTRLLAAMDEDSLTRAEFTGAFQKVIDLVKQLKQQNTDTIKALESNYANTSKELKGNHEINIGDLKKSFKGEFTNLTNTLRAKNKEIDDKMASIQNGINGKDANDKLILKRLKKELHLPTIEELKDDLPKMKLQIRDAFEILAGNERPDISSIRGLRAILKRLEDRPMGGGGGFSKIAFEYHLIDDETPTGTINGANKIFTLDNKPNPPESLKVYRGGARQRITEDYIFSSQTITFTLAPVSGEIILVDYRVG